MFKGPRHVTIWEDSTSHEDRYLRLQRGSPRRQAQTLQETCRIVPCPGRAFDLGVDEGVECPLCY